MSMEFYDLNQVDRYLSNCVITYDGEPVYVDAVANPRYEAEYTSYRVKLYPQAQLPWENTPRRKVVTVDDPKLSFLPVKLGWVNQNVFGTAKSFKAFRAPRRQWRIGLSVDTLHVVDGDIGLRSPLLYQTIMGIYPKWKDAYALAGKRPNNMVGISRHFAITGESQLLHIDLDDVVGSTNPDECCLLDEYRYLQEQLEEELNADSR